VVKDHPYVGGGSNKDTVHTKIIL